MSTRPPGDDLDRMERALGWRPAAFRPAAPGRGDSGTAARWIVGEAGWAGRRAFVKLGATATTARWTRAEATNYAALAGWFLPRVIGFDDDGVRPALALDDLSSATWPPPWTADRIDAVREALAAIHATPPPPHLEPIDVAGEPNWPSVADDPMPFLSTGICSSAWLDRALPALVAAAAAAPLAGDALVHGDLRSDNVCLREGRAIVIDWNHATIANPDFDVAAWLPSLAAEGGPQPESILPDAPELAAWIAGYFCAHAGMPFLAEAPHVRELQLTQARTALPWAARALGLPQPAQAARAG